MGMGKGSDLVHDMKRFFHAARHSFLNDVPQVFEVWDKRTPPSALLQVSKYG